jgi:hypothetical protein
MANPDEELASRIVDRLRKGRLLSESALVKVQEGLSGGTLPPEEWRLIVELEMSDKKGVSQVEDK